MVNKKMAIALLFILVSIYIPTLFFTPFSQMHIVFSIMLIAMVLWLSEPVPLHITALIIPLLLIVFAGFKADKAFSPFFDPLIVLILGGFAISFALQKHGVDKYIGQKFIHKGESPRKALLILMVVTAAISMWMANSAAAAIMMPIGVVILKQNRCKPLKSKFGKALVLGIGYAATIGGVGSLVGSTPNVLAAKFLNNMYVQEGVQGQFGFLEWFYYGIPIMIMTLLIGWFALTILYKPEIKKLVVEKYQQKLKKKQKMVLAIFAITIMLWLTESIHGIGIGPISIIPLVLFYIFGLMDTKDFSKLDWDMLILIGGGLTLGMAMNASGLDLALAEMLRGMITNQPIFFVSFVVLTFGIIVTAFASNTAAAAVFIPIMIPLARLIGMDPATLAVIAALGVSFDFIMPSGTPPTTIAYATKYVRIRDLVIAGTIFSVIAILSGTLLSVFMW